MGNRLRPLTEDRPKCLIEVGGQTMLERAVRILRGVGVPELAIIRGYRGGQIAVDGARYFENPEYAHNNILHSAFCAEEAMAGGFLLSYSDIVYRPSVAEAACATDEDIAVVVDRDWKRAYEGRDLRMEDEAEVVLDADGAIRKIGKGAVSPEEATGEFIGMATFSGRGADVLRAEFHRLLEAYRGRFDEPFQRAASFRKAYLTDMLQELVDRGVRVGVVPIHGGWREIDTPQDLERASRLFAS